MLWLSNYSKFQQRSFQKVLTNIYTTVTYSLLTCPCRCFFIWADKEKLKSNMDLPYQKLFYMRKHDLGEVMFA